MKYELNYSPNEHKDALYFFEEEKLLEAYFFYNNYEHPSIHKNYEEIEFKDGVRIVYQKESRSGKTGTIVVETNKPCLLITDKKDKKDIFFYHEKELLPKKMNYIAIPSSSIKDRHIYPIIVKRGYNIYLFNFEENLQNIIMFYQHQYNAEYLSVPYLEPNPFSKEEWCEKKIGIYTDVYTFLEPGTEESGVEHPVYEGSFNRVFWRIHPDNYMSTINLTADAKWWSRKLSIISTWNKVYNTRNNIFPQELLSEKFTCIFPFSVLMYNSYFEIYFLGTLFSTMEKNKKYFYYKDSYIEKIGKNSYIVAKRGNIYPFAFIPNLGSKIDSEVWEYEGDTLDISLYETLVNKEKLATYLESRLRAKRVDILAKDKNNPIIKQALQDILEGTKYDNCIVTMQNSYNVGNCKGGTNWFLARFNWDPSIEKITIEEFKKISWFKEQLENSNSFMRVILDAINLEI